MAASTIEWGRKIPGIRKKRERQRQGQIYTEKHGVNPVEYLTDVLLRIQDHPKGRIAELLPHRWKVSFAVTVDEAPPDTPTEAT